MNDDKVDIEPLLGEGGPSPFGYHAVESYLWCPKEYQYDKVRKVTVPRAATPDYFAVGSMVHAGRAKWFAEKFNMATESIAAVMQATEDAAAKYPLPVSGEAIKEAKRYVTEYIEHYSIQAKPKVIAAEYPIEGDLYVPFVSTKRTARLDDVSFYAEAQGKLCVGECKTTGSDIPSTVLQYTMHGQPSLQVLLWKKNAAHMYGDVAGVMLDIIKKGYKGKRCEFARRFVEVTPHMLAWYERSLAANVVDAGLVKWDSEPERRITSCTRMVGRGRVQCRYFDLCRFGRDAALSYVTENDGKRLTDYEPKPGQEKMPWE
jgi:hypothetical protein